MKILSRVAVATLVLMPLTTLTAPSPVSASHCAPETAGCEVRPVTVSMQVTPVVVVRQSGTTPVNITARVQGEPGVVNYLEAILNPDSDTGDRHEVTVTLTKTGTAADGAEVWTGTLPFSNRNPSGRWRGSLYVGTDATKASGHPVQSTSTSFYVKRQTRMAVNASPEPVRKGQRLAVVGQLTRLTADGRFVAYSGKRVSLYFRPVGGSYSLVGSKTTDRYGQVGGYVTAQRDGTWQIRFGGTAHHAPSARGDYVDVR